MSDTPRTDEQELAYEAEDGSTYVHATFARKLERENNELRRDKERLDWLIDNALIKYYPTSCPDDLCRIENRDDIDEGMKGTQ